MKSHRTLTLTLALASMTMVLSLSAAAGQPPNSTIQYLNPADLGKTPSHVPGSAHGHVRQPLGYGQGYRYGHSVNGPLGDIIIWSAAPNHSHGSRIMKPRKQPHTRAPTVTGHQLQYKPEYGKTSKPGYGR